MADFNRRFKKNTVLDLVQGDPDNGNPDGALNLDSPDFKVISWLPNAQTKTLRIEVLCRADQGTIKQQHSRSLNIDLTSAPAAFRKAFKDNYDLITDYILTLPEFNDGVET